MMARSCITLFLICLLISNLIANEYVHAVSKEGGEDSMKDKANAAGTASSSSNSNEGDKQSAQKKKYKSPKEWSETKIDVAAEDIDEFENEDKEWGIKRSPNMFQPGMIFVKIKKGYSDYEISKLTTRWAELALASKLEIKAFKTKPDQLLVTPVRKDFSRDVLKLILSMPEVIMATLDGKDYNPGDLRDDDDDDDDDEL